MSDIQSRNDALRLLRAATIFLIGLGFFCPAVPLAAGAQGAMNLPPASSETYTDAQANPAAQAGPMTSGSQHSSLGPPSIPVEEIIKTFAAKEAEFKAERDNFTYTQTFVFQTLDETGHVDGEYRRTSDIVFDNKGRRIEHYTYAPAPTLERIELTQEDFNDIENTYPFVLTTNELSQYDIKYVDHVQLDELTTYTFDVAPKTFEKNQRYFQGRIWVDDKDFQIVKTYGRPVGYTKKRSGQEQVFPQFETFRENIEGKYWFPTYTRANEVFHFKGGDPIHIRMSLKYENYKRFGVTVKIGTPAKVPETDEKK